MAVVAQASNLQPGQIVKCVAVDAVGLTKGKYYTVLAVRDGWVQVVTDFGVESSYAEGRFRLTDRDVVSTFSHATVQTDAERVGPVREEDMLRALNRYRGNRQVVLIVEDDRNLRAVTCDQLRELNYTVLEEGDASRAQELLRSDPTIELIFTDIVLPSGMSGFELARWCQTGRPDVKVLLTTGFPRSRQVSEMAATADWPLLGKPYGLLELASHIATLLSRPDEPLFLGPYLRKSGQPLFLGPYLRQA